MTVMLIANNCTVESGSFGGDQLCALKTAYLFVENQPDVSKVIMTMSPANSLGFVWQKFIDKYNVEVVWDDFNPGDWPSRWAMWDELRGSREINGQKFDHYRELYLRIHGAQRQMVLCGMERGIARKNIFEYWYYGQENLPDQCIDADWFDDSLCYYPKRTSSRDVYISPHCKTQGNMTFTFDFWSNVVRELIDYGISVTVGYDGKFCEDLLGHPLYKKHWGDHTEWFKEICSHKLVACGNTGTGWVAAACGVPMITMEPHNSVMADHRYRECGLRNIVEVVDGHKLDEMNNDIRIVARYVARRICETTRQKVVMTTGCYDILHAGHVMHLERARSMGTKLIVALNSDESVRRLKGPSRPINSVKDRKTVLEALKCVDEVKVFDADTAVDLIENIKPDVLACGRGYTLETVVGADVVQKYGGKVCITCDDNNNVDELSTTKTISQVFKSGDVAEVCRIASAYSVNPFAKLQLISYEYLSVKHLEGDIADLGTYRGGSGLVLRRLSEGKHLHLFDTWSGTPYNDDLCHHKMGEWQSSLEDCQVVVGKGQFTHYHKGIFPDCVMIEGLNQRLSHDYGHRYKPFCFVYCDMDTYQATKDAIDFFWPLLVSGGKIMFDDYGWEPCAGVKKAVDEFIAESSSNGYDIRIIENLHTCIITKV